MCISRQAIYLFVRTQATLQRVLREVGKLFAVFATMLLLGALFGNLAFAAIYNLTIEAKTDTLSLV